MTTTESKSEPENRKENTDRKKKITKKIHDFLNRNTYGFIAWVIIVFYGSWAARDIGAKVAD